MNPDTEVIYCEWLGFAGPKETEMPLDKAMLKYEQRLKALQNPTKDFAGVAMLMSFVGVKDKSGNWLVSNEGVDSE